MSRYKEIFGTNGLSLICSQLGKKKNLSIDLNNADDHINEIFDEAIMARPNFPNWEVMTAVAYIVYFDKLHMVEDLSGSELWTICRKAVNSYNKDRSIPFEKHLNKRLQEYEDAQLGILE